MRLLNLRLLALSLAASVHGAAFAFAQETHETAGQPGPLLDAALNGPPVDPLLGSETAVTAGPVEAATHAVEHHAGLPQLDPSNYPSQIFWLVIMFVVLYIVFSRRVLPTISSTLENRREHIESGFSSAEKLQKEASNVHDAYEKILNDARIKADTLYAEIERSIQAKSAKEVKAFHERIDKETRLTEARLEKAQKEIRTEMDVIVAEVARQAAEKIIGVSADLSQIKSMIKDLNEKPKAA
jgi:F-type H+-transporting ATPase subunit b